jgi:hypothetical protein
MPTDQPTSGKVCALCGQDCGLEPRQKDADGRYFHTRCVERKRKAEAGTQKAAAAGATPPPQPARQSRSGSDPLLDLARFEASAAAIEEDAGACPHCRAAMPMGAAICADCGFNRRIGKQLSAKSLASAPEALKRGGGGGMIAKGGKKTELPEFLQAEYMFLLLPAALFGILFALAQISPGMIGIYVVAYWLYGLAVGIVTLVMAFKEGIVHFLLTFFTGVYGIVFVFFINEDKRLKYAYAASVLAFIPFLVLGMDALTSFGGSGPE